MGKFYAVPKIVKMVNGVKGSWQQQSLMPGISHKNSTNFSKRAVEEENERYADHV